MVSTKLAGGGRYERMLVERATFERLCRSRELLCGQTVEPPSIHQVAREVGLSPFHLIRQFRAVFGATPHQYRIGYRLDRAKHLLASGELSVTEVCSELGFKSFGSFSHSFTRRVGRPPSAYRRRALVQVPDRVGVVPLGCLGIMGLLPRTALRNYGEA